MFNSRSLLSKKGVLGSVWTAAHSIRRLKKEQVMETDIVACVDAILNGEADEVTYRTLAYLLLGVVRIYSKKVEFLNHDFADMLREANNFTAGKRANKSVKSYCSITLPKTFELDAFNLDILEDQDFSSVHVRSREDITLADDSRLEICRENDKYYSQEDIFSDGAVSLANTPVRDVCSPWFMDIDLDSRSPNDINVLKSSMEKRVGTHFSLGKCLEKRMLGDVEKDPGFDISSNEGHQTDREQKKRHEIGILMEKSIANKSMQPMKLGDAEKESDLDMLLDEGQASGKQIKCPEVEINCQELARLKKSIDNESMEPMMLGDAQEEVGFVMPSNEGCQTDGELLEHPYVKINWQEPATTEKSVDNQQSMEKLREFGVSFVDHLLPIILGEIEKESQNAMPSREGHEMLEEQIKHPDTRINFEEPKEKRLPEMTSCTNQIQEKSSLYLSVNVSKSTGGSGVGSPELIGLRTPASKECARVLKKRKCLVDEEVVISNKVLQKQIKESSNLVRRRNNDSSTALQPWKVQKKYNLPESFFKPLIFCGGVDFGSLVSVEKSTDRLSVVTDEIPVNRVIVESLAAQMSAAPVETPVNPVLVESPISQMSVKLAKTPVDPILVESPITQISSETAEAPVNPILVGSPVTQISREQTPMAQTPFTHSTSSRLHGLQELPTPDMLKSASSFDSIENQSAFDKEQESDIGLMDEEENSSVSGNAEKCEWSAETWRVATYLHQSISNLKQHEGHNGFLSLSQGLERESRTRTECARLFFEILALKTGDYINVRQEDAYGDILVQEKPKLKQAIDAYGNKHSA